MGGGERQKKPSRKQRLKDRLNALEGKRGGGAGGGSSARGNDGPSKAEKEKAEAEELLKKQREAEAALNAEVCNHMANALKGMMGKKVGTALKRKIVDASLGTIGGMNDSTVDQTQSLLHKNSMKLRPITQSQTRGKSMH